VIRDFGRWREQPPESHPELDFVVSRGRGLLLMSAFCKVDIDARSDGTVVTLKVPLASAASRPAGDERVEALAGAD
jgi:hypothetical protein